MKLFQSWWFIVLIIWFGFSSATPRPPTLRERSDLILISLRVGNGLCLSDRTIDKELAQKVYKCYRGTQDGEREIWDKCQMDAYGALFNTVAGLRSLCDNSYRLPRFILCLGNNLRRTGIDFTESSTIVKTCEEKLLGTGRYRKRSPQA